MLVACRAAGIFVNMKPAVDRIGSCKARQGRSSAIRREGQIEKNVQDEHQHRSAVLGATHIRTQATSAYGVISYTAGRIAGTPDRLWPCSTTCRVNCRGRRLRTGSMGALNNRIVVTGSELHITTTTETNSHGLLSSNGGKILVSPDASAANGFAAANSTVILTRGTVNTWALARMAS